MKWEHEQGCIIIAELLLAVRPAGVVSILIKACPSFFMVMASGMPRGRMCSTYDVAQYPGYDIFFHGVRNRKCASSVKTGQQC